MRRIALFLLLTLTVSALSACSLLPQQQPTSTPSAADFIVMVPTSSTPQALPSVTPQPTEVILPTAIEPIPAIAGVEGLALRKGPGRLFDIMNTYAQGTAFTVMGKAPGGQWYFVVMPNSLSGWMFSEFVTLQGDAANLPLFSVTGAMVISGRVTTPDGKTATGIGVALSPANMDLAAGPDATMSDASGTYYFYLPEETTGNYVVGANGYNCEGNLIVGNCELPYQFPGVHSFMLPDDAGMAFDFELIRN
jgi:hypothetical protein